MNCKTHKNCKTVNWYKIAVSITPDKPGDLLKRLQQYDQPIAKQPQKEALPVPFQKGDAILFTNPITKKPTVGSFFQVQKDVPGLYPPYRFIGWYNIQEGGTGRNFILNPQVDKMVKNDISFYKVGDLVRMVAYPENENPAKIINIIDNKQVEVITGSHRKMRISLYGIIKL